MKKVEFKDFIDLYMLGELSQKEIAQYLNVTQKTVGGWVRKLKQVVPTLTPEKKIDDRYLVTVLKSRLIEATNNKESTTEEIYHLSIALKNALQILKFFQKQKINQIKTTRKLYEKPSQN